MPPGLSATDLIAEDFQPSYGGPDAITKFSPGDNQVVAQLKHLHGVLGHRWWFLSETVQSMITDGRSLSERNLRSISRDGPSSGYPMGKGKAVRTSSWPPEAYWQHALESMGVNERLCDAMMHSEYTDLRRTRSASYWVLDTVGIAWEFHEGLDKRIRKKRDERVTTVDVPLKVKVKGSTKERTQMAEMAKGHTGCYWTCICSKTADSNLPVKGTLVNWGTEAPHPRDVLEYYKNAKFPLPDPSSEPSEVYLLAIHRKWMPLTTPP
ncbi:uncharacterized protein B0T15DRAFT_497037 [Chaetomium strumarium]|uniref:Uncharacterized protein n=1 Tax=Chaetomium strumarium TaxID=1170767 RepID=A0AAJ0GMC0_9PEZI|nr:hypothetical protein B0T15DRAFT_497037 [Chaetomium strumarium]